MVVAGLFSFSSTSSASILAASAAAAIAASSSAVVVVFVYATVSTKSLNWFIVSVSKYVSLVVDVLATEDKTSAARVEYGSFTDTVAILSSIEPTVEASDFVITFANIIESAALLPALATAASINLLTWVCSAVSNEVLFSKLLSATDDKICSERLVSVLLPWFWKEFCSSKSWILSTIKLIVSTSLLVNTFANNLVPSSLLPALATASSINLLTWFCSSVSKVAKFCDDMSATEDKTCNEKLEFGSLCPFIWILSTIMPIVPTSDLVIIFASIIEPESLFPEFATASSINLLTCVCFSSSNITLFWVLTSAREDKTCSEKFEPALLTSSTST